jgi:hypothetical protein
MNDIRATTEQRQTRGRHVSVCLAMATVCALGAGCASGPPPRDLDLRGARIVPMATMPTLDVNGLPGGKPMGAAVGAGTGSGAGVVVGVVGCLATGPLFPLCVAAFVPTAAAVGAATGAVVGAVRTDSSEALELKAKVLKDEMVASSYQTLLAQKLQERLHDDYPLDGPATDSAAGDAVTGSGDRPWTIEVGVVEVGTEGKNEFALRLVTRLTLRHGSAAAVWQTAKEVQSDTELTTSQWIASDSKALRGVLDRCIRRAAHQLVTDLGRTTPGQRAPVPSKYSTSCQDTPAEWQEARSKP